MLGRRAQVTSNEVKTQNTVQKTVFVLSGICYRFLAADGDGCDPKLLSTLQVSLVQPEDKNAANSLTYFKYTKTNSSMKNRPNLFIKITFKTVIQL